MRPQEALERSELVGGECRIDRPAGGQHRDDLAVGVSAHEALVHELPGIPSADLGGLSRIERLRNRVFGHDQRSRPGGLGVSQADRQCEDQTPNCGDDVAANPVIHTISRPGADPVSSLPID